MENQNINTVKNLKTIIIELTEKLDVINNMFFNEIEKTILEYANGKYDIDEFCSNIKVKKDIIIKKLLYLEERCLLYFSIL